ncbi:MAG: cation diffusion facilitator family transporter [Dehalococcoidia bacterium]|nr:cation diffusion facilitator family transporter [Dehalococcoidia bacterium]
MVKFSKHAESSPASHAKAKERSILLGLMLGIFGLVTGIIAAIIANSVTLESEILKNAGLATAVFLSYLSIRKINRGKTEGYNYGYGKLESFSGLIVAVVLVLSLIIVISHTVERFQHPVELHPKGLDVAIIFTLIALATSVWMWRHDYHLAKEEYSPVMESLWRMYRFKTIASVFVTLSLVLSYIFGDYAWSAYVDPVGSIIIGLFIVQSIYNISTMSVYDLLDRALEESLQLIILRELAGYFNDYEAIHGIRSRRSGASVYVEIFLEFDGQRKMSDVQGVIDAIKSNLEQKINGSQIVISPTTSPVA